MGALKSGTVVAALAVLAAGFGGGWVAGRASLPPVPPPDIYVNPLASVVRGESLLLRQPGGLQERIEVLEVTADSVLLSFTRLARDQPPLVRQMRVARDYNGTFRILEGDIGPEDALNVARDFIPARMEPVDLALPGLAGRVVRCWKITGATRGGDPRTFWVSAEFPVHGLLRADGATGTVWEIEAFEGK